MACEWSDKVIATHSSFGEPSRWSLLTIVTALAGVVLGISVLAIVPFWSGGLLRRLRHRLLRAHLGLHSKAELLKADKFRSSEGPSDVCDELWWRLVIGGYGR